MSLLQLDVTNVRDLGMWLRFIKVNNAAQDAEVNMNTENVETLWTLSVAIVEELIVQGTVGARLGKRLKKIKFVKVTEGLTYVEAIKSVRREDQQKEQKDSDKTVINPCDNHCRMNDKMVVEKIIHCFYGRSD